MSITGVAPPVDVILSVVPETDVTVPLFIITHDVVVPSVCSTFPVLPVCNGSNALNASFAVV